MVRWNERWLARRGPWASHLILVLAVLVAAAGGPVAEASTDDAAVRSAAIPPVASGESPPFPSGAHPHLASSEPAPVAAGAVAADPPVGPAGLRGRVLSDPSGDPVAGARVWRGEHPESAVTSDPEGFFLLPLGVPSEGEPSAGSSTPPALRLQATAEGHAPASALIPWASIQRGSLQPRSLQWGSAHSDPSQRPEPEASSGAPPAATPAAPTGDPAPTAGEPPRQADADASPAVVLVLVRLAAITGRVVGPEDEPLQGAVLRYRPVPPPGAAGTVDRQSPRPWDEDEAGHGGLFRLEGLAAGRTYQLQAFADGYGPAEWVATAGETGVLLRLAPGSGVEGRVLDATGAPATAAEVTLYLEVEDRELEGPGLPAATTGADAEGRFRLTGLTADRYTLGIKGPGAAPFRLQGLELTEGRVHDLGALLLDPEATLEGTVVDQAGAPVAQARVVPLRPDGSRLAGDEAIGGGATTGDDGRFLLRALPPGEVVDLLAEPPSPATAAVLPRVPLPADSPVEIVVPAGAVVVGRVLDPDGRPLEGVEVRARGRTGSTLRVATPVERGTVSGRDGEYRLEGLPPGETTLRADPPRDLPGHRPAVYDSLRLLAGEVHGPVDLVLHRQARVEGTVRHRDGTPASRVRVVARPVALDGSTLPRTAVTSAVTDAAGAFRLDGLAPGGLQLDAVTHRGRATWKGAVGEEGASVDLVVEPRRHVSGQVVNEEGRPVPRARVQLRTPGGAVARRVYASETTGVDGRFLLLDVAPGRYRVEASADGYASLAATDPGAVRMPEVELPDEPRGVEGVVVVLSRGASVAGRVDGVATAELGAVQVHATRTATDGTVESRPGRLGADGHYVVGGLAPGSWNVWARLPATGRSDSGRVEVRSGDQEVPLDLDLGGGLVLTGEVRVNGEPLAGGKVDVLPERRGQGVTVPLRHDGSFRAEGVAPGRVRVAVTGLPPGASLEQAVRFTREVDLPADRHLRLDFTAGTLTGRVTTPDGAPLSHADLALERLDGGQGGNAGPPATRLFTRTDHRGAFTFPQVEEGRWRLEVHGGPGHGRLLATEVVVPGVGELVVDLVAPLPQDESR